MLTASAEAKARQHAAAVQQNIGNPCSPPGRKKLNTLICSRAQGPCAPQPGQPARGPPGKRPGAQKGPPAQGHKLGKMGGLAQKVFRHTGQAPAAQHFVYNAITPRLCAPDTGAGWAEWLKMNHNVPARARMHTARQMDKIARAPFSRRAGWPFMRPASFPSLLRPPAAPSAAGRPHCQISA